MRSPFSSSLQGYSTHRLGGDLEAVGPRYMQTWPSEGSFFSPGGGPHSGHFARCSNRVNFWIMDHYHSFLFYPPSANCLRSLRGASYAQCTRAAGRHQQTRLGSCNIFNSFSRWAPKPGGLQDFGRGDWDWDEGGA